MAEMVKTVMSELKQMLTTKTVIGEEIKAGDTTLIPVVRVRFGLGAGGSSNDHKNESGGSGIGAGASITPVAFIAVEKDKVRLMPLRGRISTVEQLLESIPSVVRKLKEIRAEAREARSEKTSG